jgi:hypothetical protein
MSELKEQIKALKLEEKRRQKLQVESQKAQLKFIKLFAENPIQGQIYKWNIKNKKFTTADDLIEELGLSSCSLTINKKTSRSKKYTFLEKNELVDVAILLGFCEAELKSLELMWEEANSHYKKLNCNICLIDKCETEMGILATRTIPNNKLVQSCKCKYDICMDCCSKIYSCPLCRVSTQTCRTYKY